MRKMNNHISLLLEADAAKRKLGQLFQSELLGQPNNRSTAIVACDSIPAGRTDIEHNKNLFREPRREHGPIRLRTLTATQTRQPAK